MQRIIVNVQTGARTVVELTPEEIDAAKTRSAKELAERVTRPPSIEQRLDRVERWARSMGYV